MTETKTMTVRRLSDGTVSLMTENTNLIARTPEQVRREVDWFINCAVQHSTENSAPTQEAGDEAGFAQLLPCEAEQYLRQIALENAVKTHGNNRYSMAEITTRAAAEYLRFLRTGAEPVEKMSR